MGDQDKQRPAIVTRAGDENENKMTEESPRERAKRRWKGLLGRITSSRSPSSSKEQDGERRGENLIEEIKRMKKQKKKKQIGYDQGILSVLHSAPTVGDNMLVKQKYSAKERILNKSVSHKTSHSTTQYTISDYDIEVKLRYPITSEIRLRLEKIKMDVTREQQRRVEAEQTPRNFIQRLFDKIVNWIARTNLGETVLANYTFYKWNPHDHLPELCRRCRRPLAATLETRFTTVGILFCIFLPVIGILLLYADREFTCVVCEERYVYGDLTARPIQGDHIEGDDEL